MGGQSQKSRLRTLYWNRHTALRERRTFKSSRRARRYSAGSTELISGDVRSSVHRHQRTGVSVFERVVIVDAARSWGNGPAGAVH